MSSTRNKNTPGDYVLEQSANIHNCNYSTYEHSSYGRPTETLFAGDGLLTGRIAPTNLSHNACDVESQLFGIGSSNMVAPKRIITPDLKPIQSLNIMNRIPVILPEPLVVEHNQRHMFLN